MALARTLRFGLTQRRGINPKAGQARRAMPWQPNVAGMRYVRDSQKSGVVSKRIAR